MADVADHSRHPLAPHLRLARERLIETGTRNRLIHTARFAKVSKSIDIIDERADDVFRILVADEQRMRFSHDPAAKDDTSEDEPTLPSSIRSADEARFTDRYLQTKFTQDRLQKKLLTLAREAKTLEEEQGINALYLAIGFLHWLEDETSEIVRDAPLILLPVALRRNERTSNYELEAREEDITTNEPLKRRLAQDFGIKLPDIETEDDENWSPGLYFDLVRESISGKPKWSIEPDGMQLGFFSFAKLLMVRDLEAENWPGASILDHPIVAGLLADGFPDEPADYPDGQSLDRMFAPADLVNVVEADASQTLVIETVRKGRNLVVKGPPGTGKSQTITNIIASAVHDGKSVLFVAEKMAALNVVHSRLVKAGLKDACLELHTRSANKRLVAMELGRTLSVGGAPVASEDTTELLQLRDSLNALAEAMHAPIAGTDFSAYRCLSTLVRLSESGFVPREIEIAGVQGWTKSTLAEVIRTAEVAAGLFSKIGPPDAHPLHGINRTDLLPIDVERLRQRLTALFGNLDQINRDTTPMAGIVGLGENVNPQIVEALGRVLEHAATLSGDAAPFASRLAQRGDLAEARALAETGLALKAALVPIEARFRPAALSTNVGHLPSMLAGGHSFVGRLGGDYRRASAELQALLLRSLPKSQAERSDLVHALIECQQAKARFQESAARASALLGNLWEDDATNFAALREAVDWLRSLFGLAVNLNAVQAVQLHQYGAAPLRTLRSDIASRAAEVRKAASEVLLTLKVDIQSAFGAASLDAVPFSILRDRLELWVDNLGRLDEWAQLLGANEGLKASTGHAMAAAAAAGEIAPDAIVPTIRYVHAETLYRQFAAGQGGVIATTAERKSDLANRFREAERTRLNEVSKLIRQRHLSRMPRGGMGAMGFLRAEIAKRRGHKPLRTVVSNAGTVLQQVKPILLMSPISVAQYLPPGAMQFDLLVIDEASQVRPEDAIGAIARARQVVVVGDRQQLPPTSFFDRLLGDENEEDEEVQTPDAPPTAAAVAMESILSLCEAKSLPTRMLRWHYRSRHPSLIEVSNEHFYEGKLVLFPSPLNDSDADGLRSHRVEGAYDRGGKRHNAIEAEAVAKAVATHARHSRHRSLGVVTFSTAQRDQVTFWLDQMRRTDGDLDDFMREGADEEFFVKNIENVQGDERDVIFISVGYGPRVAGARLDSMAFGPISSEGGERRLNVLFTRARFKTEVFASFAAADIDLARTRSAGARILKHFLSAAETGISSTPRILERDPDSDFEVSVAGAIRSLGYEVDHQVGSGGYRIDLAVRHPAEQGRYLLAIECDGAAYHSALWARERDWQRQKVLESLGWKFHRVWSSDWYHRRPAEFARLKSALEAAQEPSTELETEPEPTGDRGVELQDDPPPQSVPSDLPDYEVADFPVRATEEPHAVPIARMAEIVAKIVEIEGPVHIDEIARRVAALFGKQRTGSRISERVEAGAAHLARTNGLVIKEGEFYLTTAHQQEMPLRNRSRAPASLQRPSYLPPLEIEAAIRRVVRDNGAVGSTELPRAVALLFGFQRTGQEFRPTIAPVIDDMLAKGLLVEGPFGVSFPTDP